MAKRRATKELTETELDEMLVTAGRAIEVKAVPVEVVSEDSQELTSTEKKKRKQLEKTVEKAFYEAGEALKELRDLRLYRDTHRSFEDYCRERFGHSRQKSNYLIAGAEIYQNLTTNCCQILPSTESQVRPLAPLEPLQQCQAWNAAVERAKGSVPPARLVREAARKILSQKESNPHYVGEVCLVISADEPQLRGRKGCWAIVTEVHEFSCDLQLWNGLVELIKPEYLRSFEYSEDECEQMQQLCDRIKRLRERDKLEELAYTFLGFLGKLKRPELTPLEEKLLAVLEAEYGISD
jgi:hypothetical protein